MDWGKWGLLGLLGLLVLSVLQALLVRRAVVAYQDRLDPQDRREFLARWERQGSLEPPVRRGPRAIRDPRVQLDLWAR